MRAVVTGGRGFVGSRVLAALTEAGWDAVGLDLTPGDGIEVLDILDTPAIARVFDGADLVVHTAALVGEQGGSETFWRVNVGGTASMLAAASAAAVGRVVHLSSIVVHGSHFPDGVDEDGPVHPTGNPYTDTKIASEHAVLRAAAAGLPATVVRPGNIYGPGSAQWSLRPAQMMRAGQFALIGGGRGVLSPVYVDDVVRGILLAGTTPAALGQVIHLAADGGVSCADYFGRYAEALGVRLRSVSAGVVLAVDPVARLARRVGRDLPISARTLEYLSHPGSYSIAKARRLLGWTPEVTLDEGIERTLKWLATQGVVTASTR